MGKGHFRRVCFMVALVIAMIGGSHSYASSTPQPREFSLYAHWIHGPVEGRLNDPGLQVAYRVSNSPGAPDYEDWICIPIEPFSKLAEKSYTWDEATQTATVDGNTTYTVGSKWMNYNGWIIDTAVPVFRKNGQVYVPLEFLFKYPLKRSYTEQPESKYGGCDVGIWTTDIDADKDWSQYAYVPEDKDRTDKPLLKLIYPANSTQSIDLMNSNVFLSEMRKLGYSNGKEFRSFGQGKVNVNFSSCDGYSSPFNDIVSKHDPKKKEWIIQVAMLGKFGTRELTAVVRALTDESFTQWFMWAPDFNQKKYPNGKWYTVKGYTFMIEKDNLIIHFKYK